MCVLFVTDLLNIGLKFVYFVYKSIYWQCSSELMICLIINIVVIVFALLGSIHSICCITTTLVSSVILHFIHLLVILVGVWMEFAKIVVKFLITLSVCRVIVHRLFTALLMMMVVITILSFIIMIVGVVIVTLTTRFIVLVQLGLISWTRSVSRFITNALVYHH